MCAHSFSFAGKTNQLFLFLIGMDVLLGDRHGLRQLAKLALHQQRLAVHLILLIAERPIQALDHELERPGLLALHAARVGGGPDEVGANTDLATRESAVAVFTLDILADALGVCFTADVAAHFRSNRLV